MVEALELSAAPQGGMSPRMLVELLLSLQVQVAHFEPDTITLIGEGVFPRISFNLPRDVTHEDYSRLRKRALEKLTPAEGPVEGDTANKDSQDEVTVSG